MILNKKIQNQTSKQAKKHTTKQKFKKCKMNKKKWNGYCEFQNGQICAKMNNIHAVLEQMYLN